MEKYKKLVLLDIDYTIFDTDTYRDLLYPRLATALGLSLAAFQQIAPQVYRETKEKEGYFNPHTYLQLLTAYAKKTVSDEALESIFWQNDIYVASLEKNITEVLEQLKQSGVEIGILSTGEKEHQLKKVESIKSFFSSGQIHIFPDKLKELQRILVMYPDYTVYLVDDLPRVLYEAKKITPNIQTIWRKKEKRYETTEMIQDYTPDFVVTQLEQIVSFITAE